MANQLFNQLFNLRFAAKDLERNAKKCDKAEKEEKRKLKVAISNGLMEGARIHAENAIRQKNQALSYRRMSARIDAVASRVQTAITMKSVTKSMERVVRSMASTISSMNLEQISDLMSNFEQQFEHLDVQSQVMEDTMSNSSTLTTPVSDVNSLMKEAADEAGLELNLNLPTAQTAAVGASTSQEESLEDDLSVRLAKLRQMEG